VIIHLFLVKKMPRVSLVRLKRRILASKKKDTGVLTTLSEAGGVVRELGSRLDSLSCVQSLGHATDELERCHILPMVDSQSSIVARVWLLDDSIKKCQRKGFRYHSNRP
jgi:hypothetical protein